MYVVYSLVVTHSSEVAELVVERAGLGAFQDVLEDLVDPHKLLLRTGQ